MLSMFRCLSVIFSILFSFKAFAISYYVSPSGSNSNNGTSVASAFQTLNYAANQTAPGDTVFVLNGIYTNPSPASNVLDIYNSGASTNGIVYINYPGHTPTIKLNANNWSGIALQGADYIIIDGFQIVGNNDAISLEIALAEASNTNNPATSGNGIGITREYNNDNNKPYHNTIRNCTISKCGGAGIYAYRADWTVIENNTIFECGWYSPYGNSGISLYQNWNSDSLHVTKNYIIGNTCYRNENYIPFVFVGSITDGNGIIIDDFRNTQNQSTQGIYLGRTLIANNLVYANGGRGIHAYLSDNIDIVHNTCFENCQSPAIQDGEFTAYDSESIKFINNIAMPSSNIPPIDVSNNANDILVLNNLWASNAGLASPFGTNTITGNPVFVNATSDPLLADFHLGSGSAAIDAGSLLNSPSRDKDNNSRQVPFDVGCYEYQNPPLSVSDQFNNPTFLVYPNPSANFVSIDLKNNSSEFLQMSIFDGSGRVIKKCAVQSKDGIITIDLTQLSNGIYFFQINDNSSSLRYSRSFNVIR